MHDRLMDLFYEQDEAYAVWAFGKDLYEQAHYDDPYWESICALGTELIEKIEELNALTKGKEFLGLKLMMSQIIRLQQLKNENS